MARPVTKMPLDVVSAVFWSVVLLFLFRQSEPLDHTLRIQAVQDGLSILILNLFSEPAAAMIAYVSIVLGGGADVAKFIMFFILAYIFRSVYRCSPGWLVAFSFSPQGALLIGNITPFFIGSCFAVWHTMMSVKDHSLLSKILVALIAVSFHWSMLIIVLMNSFWKSIGLNRKTIAMLLASIVAVSLLYSWLSIDFLQYIQTKIVETGNKAHIYAAIFSYLFLIPVFIVSNWRSGLQTYSIFSIFLLVIIISASFISIKASSRLAFFIDAVVFIYLSIFIEQGVLAQIRTRFLKAGHRRRNIPVSAF